MRGNKDLRSYRPTSRAHPCLVAAVCALTVAATLAWVAPAVSAAVVPRVGPAGPANPTSPWSIVPSPNLTNGRSSNQLVGVSCVSSTFCMAVGSAGDGKGIHTLSEAWDGSTWSIVPSPNVSGSTYDYLQSVSCTAGGFCIAVGYVSNLQGNKTLVEEFNGGSWTILSSPNEPGAADSYLHGVSCRSESECTAVGTYINLKQDLDGTLVETWNGGFWSIRPSPNGSTYLNNLGSVSCFSRAFCAAVGQETPHHDTFGQTLAETTKTADWAVEPSANVGTSANELDGVSCTSAELCRAVGQYFNVSEDRERPLVETWDGATWSVSPIRLFGSGLIGVSCRSARACTAVGEEGVIENWDGRSWSVVLTDRAIENNRTLNAVSCDAPTICTAVGSYVDASGVDQTFIEQRGLAVTSVTPDKGPVVGDERIAVHGFELLDVNAIDFVPKSGGEAIPAKSFTCDSEDVCDVVTPDVRSHLRGKEIGLETDIVVHTSSASSFKGPGDNYTFGGPVVDHVAENSGALKGGNEITISGSGFKGADSVSFEFRSPAGGVQIEDTDSFRFVSDHELKLKVPDITSLDPVLTDDQLATEVRVGVPNGRAGTLESALDPAKDTYTFLGPRVDALSAHGGSLSGGEKITVKGQGFTGTHFVWFIDTETEGPDHAFRAEILDVAAGGRSLTAVVPDVAKDGAFLDSNNEEATQVQVDIFGKNGTKYSSSFRPSVDRYLFTAPVITSLSQDHGPLKGEVPIDINGRGFSSDDSVKFIVTSGPNNHDMYPATIIGVKATSITVHLPDVAKEGVKVVFATNKLPTQIVVSLPGPGKRIYTSIAQPKDADVFTYDVPEVQKLSPNTGPAAGGTVVKITGLGLTGVYKVDFAIGVGSKVQYVDAPKFKVTDDTTMTVTSPSMSGQTFVGGMLTTQIVVYVPGSFPGINDYQSPTTDNDHFVYTKGGAGGAGLRWEALGAALGHAVQLRAGGGA